MFSLSFLSFVVLHWMQYHNPFNQFAFNGFFLVVSNVMNNIKVLYSYLFAFSPYIQVSSKCCIHILLPFLHVFKFFFFSLGDSLGQWMWPDYNTQISMLCSFDTFLINRRHFWFVTNMRHFLFDFPSILCILYYCYTEITSVGVTYLKKEWLHLFSWQQWEVA